MKEVAKGDASSPHPPFLIEHQWSEISTENYQNRIYQHCNVLYTEIHPSHPSNYSTTVLHPSEDGFWPSFSVAAKMFSSYLGSSITFPRAFRATINNGEGRIGWFRQHKVKYMQMKIMTTKMETTKTNTTKTNTRNTHTRNANTRNANTRNTNTRNTKTTKTRGVLVDSSNTDKDNKY